MKKYMFLLFISLIIISCNNSNEPKEVNYKCGNENTIEGMNSRSFKMGFSTWPFGPNLQDVNQTYNFIANNSDIYSEHIDDKVPWDAWINGTELPIEFTNMVDGRVDRKINGSDLVLSVSILNTDRTDIINDYNNRPPAYESINDDHIKEAYFKHLDYLVTRLNPRYLVIAIEVNELIIHSPSKWEEYKLLAVDIISRLKENYPNLKISQSITLHNLYQANETESQDVFNYINTNSDFAAISFYPFFKNLHTEEEFTSALNYLNDNVDLPISFVETAHLSEDLVIPNLNVNISSNECEQRDYVKVLLQNAYDNNYEFVIWWAYKDFDSLWETFPAEVKDLGQIWRDTGLIDENDNKREAYYMWEYVWRVQP